MADDNIVPILIPTEEVEILDAELVRPQSRDWTINIRTLTGKILLIADVGPTTSVAAVKEKIAKLEGCAVEQQRLIFADEELANNNRALSAYRVTNGVTIQLSLRGGNNTRGRECEVIVIH
jgi:hypothetical protein